MSWSYCVACFVIGFIVAWVIAFVIPRSKIRKANDALDKQEATIKQQINNLKILQQKLQEENEKQKHENNYLIEQNQKILISSQELSEQAHSKAEEQYNKQMKLFSDKLDMALEKKSREYQAAEDDYRNEYAATLAEYAKEFEQLMAQKTQSLESIQEQIKSAAGRLADLQSVVNAAVEANIRAEEERTAADFYRIQISESDLAEIAKLREVEPYLRDKEALNKVIWKVYYEKPTADLIGRIIGSNVKTGIYKITEISTGKCYVGQARDIASRWRQHIKRGIGAEPPTRNKLYPAMRQAGVENFSFELVEECSIKDLDEKEDMWQDYFQAKTYGFSIK